MSDQVQRIQRAALRLARLAALDAPAVILADAADQIDKYVSDHCAATDFDRAAFRAQKEADRAAALAHDDALSEQDAGQLDAEEAAFNAAEHKAKAGSGYSDTEWDRLDSSYRFGLVMDHFVEPPSSGPAPSVSEER